MDHSGSHCTSHLSKSTFIITRHSSQISSGLTTARSGDTSALRHLLTFAVSKPETPLTPSLTHDKSKVSRGLNHPVLRELICPQKYLSQLQSDPDRYVYAHICIIICSAELFLSYSTLLQLQNGQLKMTAKNWPAFLYEEGIYDPEQIDLGLLRGYLSVRVSSSSLRLTIFSPRSCIVRKKNLSWPYCWFQETYGRKHRYHCPAKQRPAPWTSHNPRNDRVFCSTSKL